MQNIRKSVIDIRTLIYSRNYGANAFTAHYLAGAKQFFSAVYEIREKFSLDYR